MVPQKKKLKRDIKLRRGCVCNIRRKYHKKKYYRINELLNELDGVHASRYGWV